MQKWTDRIFLKKVKKGILRVVASQKGKTVPKKEHQSAHLGKMKKRKIELESNRGLSFLKIVWFGVFRTRLTGPWFTSVLRNPRISRTPHPNLRTPYFRARLFARLSRVTWHAGDRYVSSCGITCICGFLTLEFGESAEIWTDSNRGNEKICTRVWKCASANIFEKSEPNMKKWENRKIRKVRFLWFLKIPNSKILGLGFCDFSHARKKVSHTRESSCFHVLSVLSLLFISTGNGLTFLCNLRNMNVHACSRGTWHTCQKGAHLRADSRWNERVSRIKMIRSDTKLFFHFYQLFSFTT